MSSLSTQTALAISLVISLSLSGCVLLAAGATGAEAGYVLTQEDRTPNETLNDQRITASIKTRLIADPEVSAMDINVDTHKGLVRLKGVVDRNSQIDRAIEIARSVKGVNDVIPDLYVTR